VKLPETEEYIIRSSILEYQGELVGFHALRTRKAGNQRYVDLHLVVPKMASVEEAHRLCDELERDIGNRLGNVNVVIHIEPCDGKCDHCTIPPDQRKYSS
jgi:divalent metal cation (Fe/Co/Zn/Cd) transporter